MARTVTYFPRLSAFDPAEASEGSLDPLGLAQLAGQLADTLVPGYTERSRRPRFLVALALGSRLLDRAKYADGVYGDHPDGPANIAFERLLVEAYARIAPSSDEGLKGVPGIGKARDAAEADVRLSSRLHLVAPGAVGLWVAYKGLARTLHILDDSGHLQENGHELLRAWEQGIGKPGLVTGSGDITANFLGDLDRALQPLLGDGPTGMKPRGAWQLIYECLHPAGMTRPEADVLRRILFEDDARRADVFAKVERNWSSAPDLMELPEHVVLGTLQRDGDAETRKHVEAISAYEDVVVLLTRAFYSVLHVGSKQPDGRVDLAAVLGSEAVGAIFLEAPDRLRTAVERAEGLLDAVGEGESADRALGWLHDGAMESPERLFERLLLRHFETQQRKPPEGKRPWIEGEAEARFVRRRYARKEPPEDYVTFHPYRTAPVRRTLADLWLAER